MTELTCLTMLIPSASEEQVVDWLLAQGDAGVEFSVHPVAARGPLVRLAAAEEQVRGHARRVEIKLIAGRTRIEALARELEALLAGTPGGYWVMPVERFVGFDREAQRPVGAPPPSPPSSPSSSTEDPQ